MMSHSDLCLHKHTWLSVSFCVSHTLNPPPLHVIIISLFCLALAQIRSARLNKAGDGETDYKDEKRRREGALVL